MDNLTKFPTNAEAAAVACKRDTLAMSCVAGVAAGAAGGSVNNTPAVSTHTSTWLAALHVNNNNNSEKSFLDKDLHKCNVVNPSMVGKTLSSSPAWQCDSCDIYQKNGTSSNAATLPRVALNEEDEGGGNTIGKVGVYLTKFFAIFLYK